MITKHHLAAIVLTAITNSCAVLWPPTIEQQLRNAYGCIGIGHVSPETVEQNRSLAETTAKNRARADYQRNCLGDNLGRQKLIETVYDPNTHAAYAFQRRK
ncbi:hypothetical protein J4479_00920 [Candidatus Woesearchaeota archaeon]|nr:hypothetical protein [Candidatus Woesearchaeota archaeon]